MKNTKDLKVFLLRQIQDLNDGKLTCGEAMASAAIAGRIIDCEKLEIQFNELHRRRDITTIEEQRVEEPQAAIIHRDMQTSQPPLKPFYEARVLEYVKWE